MGVVATGLYSTNKYQILIQKVLKPFDVQIKIGKMFENWVKSINFGEIFNKFLFFVQILLERVHSLNLKYWLVVVGAGKRDLFRVFWSGMVGGWCTVSPADLMQCVIISH